MKRTETVANWVVDRPKTVVLGFLLVTALFAVGLGQVSTTAGTEQFTEGTPAQEAFEDVQREFGAPFGPDSGTTQLIQTDRNVLAKGELLATLRALEALAERPDLRVESTQSAAGLIATELDPDATTLAEKRRAIDRADEAEIDAAVATLSDRPSFTDLVSDDFNPTSATASATVAVVTHRIPTELDEGGGGGGEPGPMTPIQLRSRGIVDAVDADLRVFGQGIIAAEFSNVIGDSLLLVVPAAIVLILAFLIVSYRDPVDLALGTISLAMTLVWTFGFLGLTGIPFTQFLIAVPPLLLAVGIDFGIHTINRYREERVTGAGVDASIRRALDQLLVAFAIVTGTTVIGFAANLTSRLAPIREFGIVAAVGIAFTLLVFGLFLPAAKVASDRFRAAHDLPAFGQQPLGREGSRLATVLSGGVAVARRAPVAFLVVVLLVSGGSAAYATGIDTAFSQEDFLPPEETPAYLEDLPEPFAPNQYTVTRDIQFLEDNFEAAQGETVTIFLQGPLTRDTTLESVQKAGRNPPESFVSRDRRADSTSIVTVIRDYANESAEFRALVERNDVDDDGVPDDNLRQVYDALLTSPQRDRALQYVTEDRRSARVEYETEATASQDAITADAREVADRYRPDATATGQVVVFQSIAALILQSALVSLATALLLVAVFLVAVYAVLEDEPALGLVNLLPIAVSVALIAGTMRLLGLSFNAFTATILSITIGLGIDYSAHVVHRFADEYDGDDPFPALRRTVAGTGGALTGSMLTTAAGIGVLVFALTPVLGQFGLLTALSIVYSYVVAIAITPSAIAVWARYTD
ncbi:RND transporter [Halorientalis sp. IM1011]|uniref:efflux RND transporter permease subunit n=1 Tax=Halorientalis sp. IM1011 TaxID=1932360 RepID=UPI00097CC803|nr:MMPL family transporter [Halorientalis sp. IM1011]AQL43952.1 RND transporter [Halorientalis sp. IM1011]